MSPASRLSAVPRPARDAAVALLFAGIYLLIARATRSVGPTDPALLWAPSGIYLGVMILSDRRLWPLLALAALAGAFGANMLEGMSPAESIA
jgi:integral membrane sensor domain MASE1